MLNRISGWLLFYQASYLASFIAFALSNAATRGATFNAFTQARSALGAPNTFVRLSDYIYYPMVFSAPLNLALMLALFWTILRRGHSLSLASDFFSILNAIYIAASGWILFMAFTNFVHK